MKEAFIDRKFKKESLAMIEMVNAIIANYQAQGFVLTLRQLYYQLVARDVIPNTERSYKNLGSVVNDGRLAGLIDWEAIEDRTRNLQRNLRLLGPRHAVEVIAQQYGIDMWKNQPVRVEVWIEKEALAGVIEATCRRHDVPFFACRGYVSQSEQWRAYRRFQMYHQRDDQKHLMLHLGDHDPSGIDMTRDNRDRLWTFLGSPRGLEVKRIALNRNQIDEYNPPPNPAKMTDSRFGGYMQEHGDESWELDALEPGVINQLIEDEIEAARDPDLWNERVEQLATQKAKLEAIIDTLEDE